MRSDQSAPAITQYREKFCQEIPTVAARTPLQLCCGIESELHAIRRFRGQVRVVVGTLRLGIAVALLFGCALLAGCNAHEVRDRQAMGAIQFGIWRPDADGAMRFTATAQVPNEEDQAFGWRVRVAESEHAVKWIETVTWPEAPDTWGDLEDDPNVMISEDGRTATTVGAVIPDGGYLEGTWYVAIGDPAGAYVITVELSDGRRASFTFRLDEPAETPNGTVTGA